MSIAGNSGFPGVELAVSAGEITHHVHVLASSLSYYSPLQRQS